MSKTELQRIKKSTYYCHFININMKYEPDRVVHSCNLVLERLKQEDQG